MNWEVKRLNKERDKDIQKLRKTVFGLEDSDKLKHDFFKWQFLDNPAGEAILIGATGGNELVGFYGIVPQDYGVDDRIVKGSIVVDVMTHPEYRKQGMFVSLGAFGMSEAENEKIIFCNGFPVRKEVLPGHFKVGWKFLMEIPVLAIPLNFSNIINTILNNKTLSGFIAPFASATYLACNYHSKSYKNIHKISSFSVLHSDLTVKNGLNATLHQLRSPVYLNWRYINNPVRKYLMLEYKENKEVLGYLVAREADIFGLKCMAIADMQAVDYNAFTNLINCIHDLALSNNCDLIAVMCSKASCNYGYFKKIGFIWTRRNFGYIVHLNTNNSINNVLMDSDKWNLLWGDTDVM